MARRTGRGGGGGGGGLKAGIFSGFSILLILAFVVAWANSNNIRSISDALDYFRTASSQIENCGVSDLHWTCETPIPGYEEGKGAKIPSANGGKTEDKQVTVSQLTKQLNSLVVKPEQSVDYSRSDWKHWSDLDGNGCDTREDLLIKSGTNVTHDPSTCKITAGTWVEPYAKTKVTDSSKLDIDHVVALSLAAKSGGEKLSAAKKEQLANDPQNLYISIAKENRSKGDKGPSEYLPPNGAFQCQYVTSFVTIVDKYGLTITEADKKAVENVIKTKC